ncbi:protein CANDIDATE G-PROTEIN COUPLED RECEPTOR 2-like isoform X1 [Glycine max]|uniref:protein CANDIDATE G-PROTEIN COUPLED RECEPTOR 2-like isoform X1 n=1 Tax=Glycine max TaxID=3847 RepID=UPI000E21B38A|nr:uncharacterized protein LOC100783834 isoform X1 [Glycine max]|eukprot:XP_025983470.1 uncharacterized protein LOC100783834 isoform X1 [Glycine max]
MVPQSVITQVSDSSGVNAISNVSSGHGFYDWLFECHGFWHNATLNIPSFLFVFYLALQARHSLLKLSLARSYIIISYNLCLWLITLLNLAWCFLQAWECTSGRKLTWNLLSLFTTSGMLFLEVSLLAFLFQGNNAGGLDAMKRTFGISTLVVGLDILLKQKLPFTSMLQLCSFLMRLRHLLVALLELVLRLLSGCIVSRLSSTMHFIFLFCIQHS